MTATLRLTRPFRLADLVWPYQIVLDGKGVGEIASRETVQIPTAAGVHTLQIRSHHVVNRRLGFTSPTITIEVRDNEAADFVCQPSTFIKALPRWIKCVTGERTQWIAIERVSTRDP